MYQEKMKNIIILKDVPSNLIDEAIIILKENNANNKKRREEYAKDEAKNIIKEYIENDRKINKKFKRKKYILF